MAPRHLVAGALLVVLTGGAVLTGAAPVVGAPHAERTPAGAQNCPPPESDRVRAPSDGAPTLAVQPFRLDASRVDLYQVDSANSNKVVSVTTRQGSKRVLKLVVGAVDVTDLRLTTMADGGSGLTLSTPAGSVARLIGPITLYLEKMCGTLAAGPLGLGFGVPGAFVPPISAASPPPFVPPEATFTDVTVYSAGLLGAQLEAPRALVAVG